MFFHFCGGDDFGLGVGLGFESGQQSLPEKSERETNGGAQIAAMAVARGGSG